jgi:Holliday junction resolvasome RuvABC endonuclease subunit
MAILLGIDGGFAAMGYAIATWDGTNLHVRDMGLHETKKIAKAGYSMSEDNVRRARLLTKKLSPGMATAQCVCAEAMSYPRSSATASKLGISWGVVAALAERHGVPIVQKPPQDLKWAVAGSRTASKGQIRAALSMHYPSSMEAFEKAGVTASKAEHCWDALGAIVACLDTDIVRALVIR